MRGRCHLWEDDDRCARLENVVLEFLDIEHMAVYTPGRTRTHMTVHAYAEGCKQTHRHTQAVIDPSGRPKMDV